MLSKISCFVIFRVNSGDISIVDELVCDEIVIIKEMWILLIIRGFICWNVASKEQKHVIERHAQIVNIRNECNPANLQVNNQNNVDSHHRLQNKYTVVVYTCLDHGAGSQNNGSTKKWSWHRHSQHKVHSTFNRTSTTHIKSTSQNIIYIFLSFSL